MSQERHITEPITVEPSKTEDGSLWPENWHCICIGGKQVGLDYRERPYSPMFWLTANDLIDLKIAIDKALIEKQVNSSQTLDAITRKPLNETDRYQEK